jgi:hypothetical protein
MVRLPVSGRLVALRAPDGADELALQDARGSAVAVALLLLERLARPADGGDAAWDGLAVTDFEVLVARLRQQVLGPMLSCGFACPLCAARVELEVGITGYLAPVRPTRPRAVAEDAVRPGWFRLAGAAFRLPTAGDQCAALEAARGARLLAEACIDPVGLSGPVRGRIERAMAAMAPEVSRPVAGVCPTCGAAVRAGLHIPALVVAEFRRAAARVAEDVHLIAGAYGWSESAILALPGRRRQDYARRIRRVAA